MAVAFPNREARLEALAVANYLAAATPYKARSFSQSTEREAELMETVVTSALQVTVNSEGVAQLTTPNGEIVLKPGLMCNEEALVLADALLELLQGSAPELQTLRAVYIKPMVSRFLAKYRRTVSVPQATVTPIRRGINRRLSAIHNGLGEAGRGTSRNR